MKKQEPMSTLNWSQVQSWISNNPYSKSSLIPFVSSKQCIQGDIEMVDSEGWTKTSVNPATPLSAVLIAQDSDYQLSNENVRRSTLRDETTDMQEKAILHLKGRIWPVRRTAEGIAACGLEEGRSSQWPELGWRALCALRECQIIVVNNDKKSLHFYPEDVRTWSNEKDTICVDYECRYVWTHANTGSAVLKYISMKEAEAYTIEWPLAEGSMDDLKETYKKMNEPYSGQSGKLNKETLQKRIGRHQSLDLFSSWKN